MMVEIEHPVNTNLVVVGQTPQTECELVLQLEVGLAAQDGDQHGDAVALRECKSTGVIMYSATTTLTCTNPLATAFADSAPMFECTNCSAK